MEWNGVRLIPHVLNNSSTLYMITVIPTWAWAQGGAMINDLIITPGWHMDTATRGASVPIGRAGWLW